MENYLSLHIKNKQIKKITKKYVLADGLEVQVFDYSPIGFDDRFYDKYGYDTLLKRGTAYIQTKNKGVWLLGLPKFGYIDDNSPKTPIWYFTEKENGECAHVAFLDHDHIVIGSKNVHIVFCRDPTMYACDMKMYEALSEPRLEYAIRIAKMLEGYEWNSDIIDQMHRNHMTMVLEVMFNNHIVYYPEEKWCVTAFTQDGKVMDPETSQYICQMNCLPFVEMQVAKTTHDYETLCKMFTNSLRDSEGAVVYHVDDYKNVRLFKLKHPVYVAKRAARELIKKKVSKLEWEKRMDNLHVEVPSTLLESLFQFYLWILYTNKEYDAEDIQQRFGKLWKEFNSLGDIPSLDAESLLLDKRNKTTKVLAFIGIPGSGKSTLTNALEKHYQAIGVPVKRVNQDELGKDRKRYMRALTDVMRANWDGVLLVDKANHTSRLRQDISDLFLNVDWFHFTSTELPMVEACKARIYERGMRHLSLYPCSSLNGILQRFFEEMEIPENSIPLPMEEPVEQLIVRVTGTTPQSIAAPTPTYPKILYWKIDLPDDKHVTLCYKPNKADNEKLEPFFGTPVQIEVDAIYETRSLRVARVKTTPFLEMYCQNKYPHITLWVGKNTKAVEANGIFEDPMATVKETHEIYTGVITIVPA